MMINLKHLIFIPSLILGTLITVSSSSWFSAWMGLEINLMSMAPLLINKIQYPSVEATIKYFIAQAIASSLLMFFFVSSSFLQTMTTNLLVFKNLMLISLLTKAGVAPLHFWFPQVMLCSDWGQSFTLLTWQKIAPFVLISFLTSNIVLLFVMSSVILGLLGGINQSSFNLILSYSSILHSGWMITLMMLNELQWWGYFFVYCLMVLSVSFMLHTFSIKKITEIHNLWASNKIKLMFFINFLSMAGLPPFMGFSIKFLAIVSILNSGIIPFIIPVILMLTSFLSFYFYLRMTYSFLFMSSSWSLMFSKNSINLAPLSTSVLFASISIAGSIFLPFLTTLT